jgi:predicted MPP superfamily phosphohydrolase
MKMPTAYVLVAVAVFGHTALWVGVLNRAHAFAIQRVVLKILDKPILVMIGGVPLWLAMEWVLDPSAPHRWRLAFWDHAWLAAYTIICWLVAVTTCVAYLRRIWRAQAACLLSNHTTRLDVARRLGEKPIGGASTACMDLVPGHQMFQLVVNEKTLSLDRLAPALDGLTVVHLSDLHFSGRIRRSYFEFVMQQANDLDADLIAVTGDLLDADSCLAWFPRTLGKLTARHGVFVVLGNHDWRMPDPGAIRRAITDLGLVDLGGRWQTLSVRGERILLAGNEWPWFGPRPDLPERDTAGGSPDGLRLLLSHSPDQLGWARRHGFDLMLAGHMHGGQIRFPLIGPVLAPSLHGVKYAAGVFDERPTMLHVTRGISGKDPIRINCPPEVTRLVLKCTA